VQQCNSGCIANLITANVLGGIHYRVHPIGSRASTRLSRGVLFCCSSRSNAIAAKRLTTETRRSANSKHQLFQLQNRLNRDFMCSLSQKPGSRAIGHFLCPRGLRLVRNCRTRYSVHDSDRAFETPAVYSRKRSTVSRRIRSDHDPHNLAALLSQLATTSLTI
jgi:hypothetical protein